MSSDVHAPIMVNEILEFSKGIEPGPRRIVDGTFGRGGHTRYFLNAFPDAKVIAFDKDQTAIEFAQKNFETEITSGRLKLWHSDYKNLGENSDKFGISEGSVDLMLFDFGVSSPQLDNADRGFSFLHDGPLDMRMDQRQVLTAAQVLNEAEPEQLIRIFRDYGEIKSPGRVVRAIVNDRVQQPFASTLKLAEMIARVEGWKKKGSHPATLYFMALRIFVNSELEELDLALGKFQSLLRQGGRLMVLSFHSLEDRFVKQAFVNSTLGGPVNRKVIVATEEEQHVNPRSRSAKLRVFERGISAVKEKKNKYAEIRGKS